MAELSGINLYTYGGLNPLMNVDPLGLSFWGSFASGFVTGALTAIAVVAVAAAVVAVFPAAAAVVTGTLFVAGVVGGGQRDCERHQRSFRGQHRV